MFSRFIIIFFFKQKTAYEMRISDWSSDVCSSDFTDKSGQVVSKNVIEDQENFSYLNTAYRLMGIKSMQQQKDTDAFYADKEAGEEQAARQTTLRLETRANVRAGNFDALPNLFVQYVENADRRSTRLTPVTN